MRTEAACTLQCFFRQRYVGSDPCPEHGIELEEEPLTTDPTNKLSQRSGLETENADGKGFETGRADGSDLETENANDQDLEIENAGGKSLETEDVGVRGLGTEKADARGFDGEGFDEDAQTGDHEQKWEYQDARGAIQGPFSRKQMRGWFEAHMLPKDLPMRSDPEAPFMTSGLLFAAGAV